MGDTTNAVTGVAARLREPVRRLLARLPLRYATTRTWAVTIAVLLTLVSVFNGYATGHWWPMLSPALWFGSGLLGGWTLLTDRNRGMVEDTIARLEAAFAEREVAYKQALAEIELMKATLVDPRRLSPEGGWEQGTPSVVCPRCGDVSHYTRDVEARYCRLCRQFHWEMENPEDVEVADRAEAPEIVVVDRRGKTVRVAPVDVTALPEGGRPGVMQGGVDATDLQPGRYGVAVRAPDGRGGYDRSNMQWTHWNGRRLRPLRWYERWLPGWLPW